MNHSKEGVMKAWMAFLGIIFLSKALASPSVYEPQGPCPKKLLNASYTLCYHPKHRLALWSLHTLSPQDLRGGTRRTNDYRADGRLESPVGERDYSGSGYDRGHLVPAADRKASRHVMSETFFMSNMTPQHPSFNRGIWQSLEKKVRTLVASYGKAIIITAPILYEGLSHFRKGISLPEHHYKIVFWPETLKVIAFMIANEAPHSNELSDYQVSINELEQLTGLDFFAYLEDHIEERIESTITALE